MKRTASYTIIATIFGLAACSTSTPLEPTPAGAPPVASAPASPDLLVPELTLPDSLVLVSEVADTFEIEEKYLAGPDGVVKLAETILPLGTILPGVSFSRSSTGSLVHFAGLAPSFNGTSNEGTTTVTEEERENPCTGETIEFVFRTRMETRTKQYKDGSMRFEQTIRSHGKGETVAPIPGIRYTGKETQTTRTRTSATPPSTTEYDEQTTHYIRQGETVPNDDFYLRRVLKITTHADGSQDVKTDRFTFRCK